MTIEVYTACAFSKGGSGGNTAGVVLDGSRLSDAEKTAAAYQLGYSETAFLSPSEQADYKLEYFTPTGEVPLCGHATIGTFTVLRNLGLLEKSSYTIETKSGILNITIPQDNLIYMEQNTPVFYDILDKDELSGCFPDAYISKSLPVQIVSTGLKDILLPLDNPAELEHLKPDFPAIAKLCREKVCVGIHAFTLVKEQERTAICRNFAPLYGIDEESATGTSNGALACYLYQNGIRQTEYLFEQGHHLNSVSRIYVSLQTDHDTITGVSVGGDGYLLGRGQIEV